MPRTELEEKEKQRLVEEIMEELEHRLRPRALVLGTLTQEEESLLEAYFIPAELRGEGQADYAFAVAAGLSLKAMSGLALGLGENEEAACILYALLQGKRVYLLERGLEYRSYKDTAHKALYRLYQEYETRLRGFGVQIIRDISQIAREEGRMLFAASRTHPGYADLRGQKLLRESDFGRVRGSGAAVVLIDRDAILTPLAADYIAGHRLEIQRETAPGTGKEG